MKWIALAVCQKLQLQNMVHVDKQPMYSVHPNIYYRRKHPFQPFPGQSHRWYQLRSQVLHRRWCKTQIVPPCRSSGQRREMDRVVEVKAIQSMRLVLEMVVKTTEPPHIILLVRPATLMLTQCRAYIIHLYCKRKIVSFNTYLCNPPQNLKIMFIHILQPQNVIGGFSRVHNPPSNQFMGHVI